MLNMFQDLKCNQRFQKKIATSNGDDQTGLQVQIIKILNPLRPSGSYMNHLLWQSVMLHFVFIGFARFSLQTAIISLNSVNQLIFVMVKCVLFEVRTEFLNNI
jgi:hypothetical protein